MKNFDRVSNLFANALVMLVRTMPIRGEVGWFGHNLGKNITLR